jgi:hypothetical protein
MLTINELEKQLKELQNELRTKLTTNSHEDNARLLTAISVTKDTLLECYRNAYTKNIACPAVTGNVDVIKNSSTNGAAPLRVIK